MLSISRRIRAFRDNGNAVEAIPSGSFVTCENGHLICEVVKPITVGMLHWADCLGAWRIVPPVIGKPTKPCSCGARWIFGAPINRLFIEGRGWVPPLEML